MTHPTEHQEQKALVKWAQYRSATLPELRMLAAIPNGGRRDPVTGALLKAEGTQRGFPDLFLYVPRRVYHGLAIELKRRVGGRVSPAQAEWLNRLREQGYKAIVCYGWDDARRVIEGYLGATEE